MENKLLEEKLIEDFIDEGEEDADAELAEKLLESERRGGKRGHPQQGNSPTNRFSSELSKAIKCRYKEKPVLKICQRCLWNCKQTEVIGLTYFECHEYKKA